MSKQEQKISKEEKHIVRRINHPKRNVRIENITARGSSDEEKAYIINNFLNENFFEPMFNNPDKRLKMLEMGKEYNYLYKYLIVFADELDRTMGAYYLIHSMLANVVLDYPQAENEHPVVTSLRDNIEKLFEFSKDDSSTVCKFKSCDKNYQTHYGEMFKHILCSIKDFPKNIDRNSFRKIKEDLTYQIEKYPT